MTLCAHSYFEVRFAELKSKIRFDFLEDKIKTANRKLDRIGIYDVPDAYAAYRSYIANRPSINPYSTVTVEWSMDSIERDMLPSTQFFIELDEKILYGMNATIGGFEWQVANEIK